MYGALRRSALLHELELFMPTTLSDEQPLRRALMAAAELFWRRAERRVGKSQRVEKGGEEWLTVL
jgi:hypothetical protein